MSQGIPTAKLRLESAMVNPPKPLGFGVEVDGKIIAVIDIAEVRRAVEALDRLEKNRTDFPVYGSREVEDGK